MHSVLSPRDSKVIIDEFVGPILISRRQKASQISPHYEALWQAIETLYSAGGKRLRPYLALLSYQAFGGDSLEKILPVAAAQELTHLALLIHDDIIDRDLVRYGVLNITGQFMDAYSNLIHDESERRHYAESAAIIAGDLLLSDAYVLAGESGAKDLHEALFDVLGGGLLDAEAVFREDRAHPLLIAEQKTASYSFVGPLLTGARLAGATVQQCSRLRRLAEQLGIGFQLRDDLIGVFGDEAVTGKSTDGDLREGKFTVLIEEFFKTADPASQKKFSGIFGKRDADSDDIARARQLLASSGAKAAVERQIGQYREEALKILKDLHLKPEYDEAFTSLIDLCLNRDF
jgi:geranylgeranyl diphosphate synthase type II